ncbi:MAG: beta-ketoacyl-[acyl-carrier-protein] synthase family protein [Ruminococcus sp.]|nr:beta-ketoacyl-[acyl-carrier-protein] synthase family protein [Ruminococcus sp.]
MNKVVITGLGAVTALGNNTADYWENLIAGKSGMKTIDRIPLEHHDTTVAAQVDDSFEKETSKYFKKRQLSATTLSIRMALASAGEAIENAGDISGIDKKRVAVVYGVSDNSYNGAELENPAHVILKKMPSEIPAMISIKYGFTGASFNVSTACASSAYAMALAKQFIASGMYDMVIVGGVSNTVSHLEITGFNQLLAMSANPDPETACRPFSKNRDGFIMGEGGGTLVLESETSAKNRNAKIYCELAGASMTDEAYNLTAPKTGGTGMAETMRLALEDAGMKPDEINYINAHGTSTNLNDLYETMAIKDVFGEQAKQIPVSSIKAAIGHTLAAGGALEAIACVKAIETGIIPPTLHFDEADPELDLDYVPNTARQQEVTGALSNSFGFGGHNATVIFRKYTEV